jgi:hypothetical protein
MVHSRHLMEARVKKKTKRAPHTSKPPSKPAPKTIFVAVDRSSGRVRVADANRSFVERWTLGMEKLYAVERYAHVQPER